MGKMIQDQFTADAQEANVTLVTADYHMPRASWLFRNVANAMQVKVSWTLLEVPSQGTSEEISKNLRQETNILQYFGKLSWSELSKLSNLVGCTKDIEMEDISRPKQELEQKKVNNNKISADQEKEETVYQNTSKAKISCKSS